MTESRAVTGSRAVTERTQVGIVGGGPAGLLLSHLLALQGIESVVVELRSREHCEARQRAGVIEQGSADLLRTAGLGERMDREALVHGGIYLQFAGERHHVDFRDLTGGRTVLVYAQTEIVKDLIAARIAAGQRLEFSVTDTAIAGIDGDRPVMSYTDSAGVRHDVECDVIAGCDGFHGICRPAVPGLVSVDRVYPYCWLGILARVAPSTDELIYSRNERGFALHSLRSNTVSRLYIQVPPEERIEDWPDEQIWAELRRRFALPGWHLADGPVTEKGITEMRSFVSSPMRHGRLFLAGDAAHIVPATGAKGLNLAVHDVRVLSAGLATWYGGGGSEALDRYSERCLDRVWRVQEFSSSMSSMLHRLPDDDGGFRRRLQLAQLRYVTGSEAAARSLAENYVGLPHAN
ncbi:MAG TPA: 4-hydroxybenzoate 3-monooxygenase [Micromonosporaceae bacterium]|nr:4-hydroxybenzoate 3-monooxygenase [Micromonosporaceae bacterium]